MVVPTVINSYGFGWVLSVGHIRAPCRSPE